MLVFCFHGGALGHTTAALIDSCTLEGSGKMPSFYPGKNLHHHKVKSKLFKIRHPHCDISEEKSHGNTVIAASSNNEFGRFLILLMGLNKEQNDEPKVNHAIKYNQFGSSYGEELEILSLTLFDKVRSNTTWLTDADNVLDIMSYWNNQNAVLEWLRDCGFTPDNNKVLSFCERVVETNRVYFDQITKCSNIVNDVMCGNVDYLVDLSFFQTAVCYAMLLRQTNKRHYELKLLQSHPTSIGQFKDIFCI